MLLAWQGIRIITALSPGNLPRVESVAIDLAALLSSRGRSSQRLCLDSRRRCERSPATWWTRCATGGDTGGVRGNKLRSALVVLEVALSLVLLIGAGLMVRSFAQIQRVEPGFDAQNVVTFNAPVQFLKYLTTASRANFANQLAERLRAIPGVERVGGVTPLPLAGGEQYSVGSYGRIGGPDKVYQANKADYKAVLPGYFEAMGIRLVSGRTFELRTTKMKRWTWRSSIGSSRSASSARRIRSGREVMVDHFNEQTFSLERLPVPIVGVVANVRSASLAADGRETIYVPYVFQSFLPLTYIVRTAADPAGLIAHIRAEPRPWIRTCRSPNSRHWRRRSRRPWRRRGSCWRLSPRSPSWRSSSRRSACTA